MPRYDEHAALIVVDVQNDFADPAGSLAVQGGDAIVGPINREIQAATEGGALLVFTQDWHPESTPHFAKDGGIWPVHCVMGTWGAELYPSMDVPRDAPRVLTGSNGEDGYSGFTMRDPLSGQETTTELNDLLRARDVERVVICGLATDYCVKATVLDALRLGYETTVLGEAVAAVELNEGDGERAIGQMQEAGAELV